MGFEPTTSSLGSWHSTTELRPPRVWALLSFAAMAAAARPAASHGPRWSGPIPLMGLILIRAGQVCKAIL